MPCLLVNVCLPTYSEGVLVSDCDSSGGSGGVAYLLGSVYMEIIAVDIANTTAQKAGPVPHISLFQLIAHVYQGSFSASDLR